MNVETIVDALVFLAGFVAWAVYLPQIRLLLKVKKSDTISLGLVGGSWVLQTLLFLQSIIKENWSLTFMMGLSLLALSCVIWLVSYYRLR